jgi:hypothetical protein
MVYFFLSFVFCGVGIAFFEHDRTLIGVICMILSCLMPVVKETHEQEKPALPTPAPIIIEPDPKIEARFTQIMKKLDEVKSCSALLDELSQPLQ